MRNAYADDDGGDDDVVIMSMLADGSGGVDGDCGGGVGCDDSDVVITVLLVYGGWGGDDGGGDGDGDHDGDGVVMVVPQRSWFRHECLCFEGRGVLKRCCSMLLSVIDTQQRHYHLPREPRSLTIT